MLWMHGNSGRMGQEILKAAASAAVPISGGSAAGDPSLPAKLAAALAKSNVRLIVDFSSPEGNAFLYEAFVSGRIRGKAVLIGTTGLSEAALEKWRALAIPSDLALMVAPNTSVGVLLVAKAAMQLARELSGLNYDVEITETHHRMKKDAPSGTAKFLTQAVVQGAPALKARFNRSGERQAGEIGVSSVRGGGVFGEHEIRMIGDHDEITLSHRAFSRQLFADGALVLGRWLDRQKPAVYGLLDVSLADFKSR